MRSCVVGAEGLGVGWCVVDIRGCVVGFEGVCCMCGRCVMCVVGVGGFVVDVALWQEVRWV